MKKLKTYLAIIILIISFNAVGVMGNEEKKPSVDFHFNDYYPGEEVVVSYSFINIFDFKTPQKLNDVRVKLFIEDREPYNPYKEDSLSRPEFRLIKDEVLSSYHPYGSIPNWELNFGNLEAGAYKVTFIIRGREYSERFYVSKAGMIIKFDFNKLLVFIQDKKTGKPIRAKVEFDEKISASLGNPAHGEADTDSQGLAVFEIPDHIKNKEKLDFTISATNKQIYIPPCRFPCINKSAKFRAYIFTDRPAYRPGQKVHISGITRKFENESLKPAPEQEIKVTVQTPIKKKIYSKTMKTDKKGKIDFDLDLDGEAETGKYTISMDFPNEKFERVFTVEEYRKTEFNVEAVPLKKEFSTEKKIQFKVKANYYFGKLLANTKFKYQVTILFDSLRPYNPYQPYNPYTDPPSTYGSSFNRRNQVDRDNPYKHSYSVEDDILTKSVFNNELSIFTNYVLNKPMQISYYDYNEKPIKEGSGVTDSKGEAVVTLTDGFKTPGTYVINVEMTDKSNRTSTGTGYFKVIGNDDTMNVKLERVIFSTKDKVKITCEAPSLTNTPRKFPVWIQIYRNVITREGFHSELVLEKQLPNKADKAHPLEYKPEKPGLYYIFLTVQDNAIIGQGAFFAADKNAKEPWYKFTGHYIFTGKKIYKTGETANVLITNPEKEKTVLLTLESDRIHYEKVIELKEGANFLQLPLSKAFAPNVNITVTFLKDSKNHIIDQSLLQTISVIDPDKKLKVKVDTNRENYNPAQNAQIRISTIDEKGNPTSALTAIGIVDKALYSLFPDKTPNIFKFFQSPGKLEVYTLSTLDEKARMAVRKQDSGEHEIRWYEIDSNYSNSTQFDNSIKAFVIRDPFSAVSADVPATRSYFPDTCYFNTNIITDEKGEALVNLKVPDSLTTWRITARGITDDTKAGETRKEFTVSKDMIARLITPRFIREKDELEIKGIIQNYLKTPQKVEVNLQVGGAKLIDDTDRSITLEPGSVKVLRWKIKAKEAGTAIFKLTAISKGDSDAMELKVPILPYGIKEVQAFSGSLPDNDSITISSPSEESMVCAQAGIIINPSLASSLIPSLQYLKSFPYGCVEQTMSRFLPTVEVANSFKDLSLKNPKIVKNVPQMVQQGISRLIEFQHFNGGWGWWKDDNSDLFMTAYVVYGLSRAEKAGFEFDKNCLKKGVKFLKLNINKTSDLNRKAYVLFSLSEAGEKEEKLAKLIFDKRAKLNSYGLAVAALAFHNMGMKDRAVEMAMLLEKAAVTAGSLTCWKSDKKQSGWMDNTIEITSWALLALIKITPESPAVTKAASYIILNKHGHNWNTTKDTAAAILALTQYMKSSDELNCNFTYEVCLNGETIRTGTFTKEDVSDQGIRFTIPADKLKKQDKITIAKSGKGVLYYNVSFDCYSTKAEIKAENSGIKVHREYFLVSNDKNKGESEKLIPLKSGVSKVNVNDLIRVKLTISSSRQREYVFLEDPIPSGFEFKSEATDNRGFDSYWITRQENHDEKKVLFIGNLYGYAKKCQYDISPEVPGTFHVIPAIVETMYKPGIRGNSDEMVIEVKEK